VLKKAGIVVAMVAGSLLAVTPLASAADVVPAQVTNTCSISQNAGSVTQTGTGLLGLGVIIPIVIQTSSGNCTGTSTTTVTNTNSGNTTVNSIRTRIQNSFNRRFG
jgi:hypothetical protein